MDEKNSFTANRFLTRPLQVVILDIAFSFSSICFEILSLCNWNVSYLSKSTVKMLFKRSAAVFLFISYIIICVWAKNNLPLTRVSIFLVVIEPFQKFIQSTLQCGYNIYKEGSVICIANKFYVIYLEKKIRLKYV